MTGTEHEIIAARAVQYIACPRETNLIKSFSLRSRCCVVERCYGQRFPPQCQARASWRCGSIIRTYGEALLLVCWCRSGSPTPHCSNKYQRAGDDRCISCSPKEKMVFTFAA